jgi:hypothetical protein
MNPRMHADRDFDAHLNELERELEPVLKTLWHAPAPRPAFAARLRASVMTDARPSPATLLAGPRRRWPQRAWGALAAALVGGLLVSSAALLYRPQPANAEAVLDQLQTEAANGVALGVGGCAASMATAHATTGSMLFVGAGVGKSGPVSFSSASALSDKLATALGVSGDQVRQAMLETMQSLTLATAPPPDPMAGIAQQLGVPEAQVCEAFFSSGAAQSIVIARGSGNAEYAANPAEGPDGGPALNLSTATTDQLAGIAAKLGVSPERLQTAIKATVTKAATDKLPTPPTQEQIVSTFARNLGLDEGRVRNAITQIEGNSGFYFAVPLPPGNR